LKKRGEETIVRRLSVLLATFGLASVFVGGAIASAPGALHSVYSDNWQGITFVSGLDSCPLFGAGADPFYVFEDVNLTDHIDSTYTPIPPDDFLYQIDSVGSVHGVINAPDGRYTVAGGGIKEHRVDTLAPLFFSGTGQMTISGPGGTVVGKATFQDLLGFPPQEFDLLFSSVTSCHLN
jgi:hypothetical protein